MADFDETTVSAPLWYSDVSTLLGKGKADEALRISKKQLQQCRDSKDKAGEMAALRGLVKASLCKGDAWNGKRVAAEAVQLTKAAGDNAASAAFLVLVAKAQALDKKGDKAVAAANEAIGAYKSLGIKLGEACAMNALALAYLAQDSLDDASKMAENAKEVFKAESEDHGFGMSLWTLSKIKRKESKVFQAAAIYEELITLYTKLADSDALATVHLEAAEVAFAQQDFQKTVDFAGAAEERFQQIKDRSRRGKAIVLIASAFSAAGQYDDAASAAELAVSIYTDLHDKAGQAAAMDMLASSLGAVPERADEAIKALEEACFLYRTLGDQRKEFIAMIGMAKLEMGKQPRGDSEVAERNINRAMRIAEEIGAARTKDVALGLLILANIRILRSENDKAIEDAQDAQAIFQEVGEIGGEADAYVIMGKAQLAKGNKEEALAMGQNARDLAEDLDDVSFMKRANTFSKQVGQHRTWIKGKGGDWLKDITIFNGERNATYMTYEAFEGRVMTVAKTATKSSGEAIAGIQGPGFELPSAKKQQVLYTIKWTKMPRLGRDED